MGEFLVISLLIASVIWVALPLMNAKTPKYERKKSSEKRKSLEDRKESVFAAIQDLEFDYRVGKMAEDDFQDMLAGYKREAVDIIKQLDGMNHRRRKVSKTERRLRKEQAGKSGHFCSQCGTQLGGDDSFCFNCGAKVG